MRNTDLAELRARLRAAAAPERDRSGASLLGRLRSLTGAGEGERAPLLLRDPAPERPRARRLPSAYDLEALEAPSVGELEARRRAFGQRGAEPPARLPTEPLALPPPEPPLLLLPTAAVDADELGEALRRLRPSLVRPEPSVETPFLDEDLSDDFDAESIYRAAGMLAPEPAPPALTEAQQILARLAETLEREMAALGARREL